MNGLCGNTQAFGMLLSSVDLNIGPIETCRMSEVDFVRSSKDHRRRWNRSLVGSDEDPTCPPNHNDLL